MPRKEQLFTECFLPRSGENLQVWVNRQDKRLLQRVYTLKAPEGNWILINCRNHQQDTNDVRIDIDVDAIMLPQKNVKEALNILKNPEGIGFNHHVHEHYYLFNGEIPWGKLLQTKSVDKFFGDSDEILFYSPFSWFTWESYHSRMNDIGNVPFLAKAICDEYDLMYDIQSLTFFDKDEAVTKYYHDKSSHYYYIEGSHLNQFMKKYKLSFFWIEIVYKYGDFGLKTTKGLDPSFNEIRSITAYMKSTGSALESGQN